MAKVKNVKKRFFYIYDSPRQRHREIHTDRQTNTRTSEMSLLSLPSFIETRTSTAFLVLLYAHSTTSSSPCQQQQQQLQLLV